MKSALDSLQSKIKLSPAEKRLLDLLPKDGGRVTTEELREKFYARQQTTPFNDRNVVSGVISNLIRKTKALRASPVRVCRSERRGPHPTEVWLEKRSR